VTSSGVDEAAGNLFDQGPTPAYIAREYRTSAPPASVLAWYSQHLRGMGWKYQGFIDFQKPQGYGEVASGENIFRLPPRYLLELSFLPHHQLYGVVVIAQTGSCETALSKSALPEGCYVP